MNSRRIFLVLVVVAAGLSLQLYRKTKMLKVEMPVLTQESHPDHAPKVVAPLKETVAQTQDESSNVIPVKEKIKKIRLTTLQEYREDARKNPHRPSEKMIGTVVALGELMSSVTNEHEARETVDYYKSCLLSESPNSLKAMCYRYSQELAKQYPGIQSDVAALDKDLNSEVRSILRRSRRE